MVVPLRLIRNEGNPRLRDQRCGVKSLTDALEDHGIYLGALCFNAIVPLAEIVNDGHTTELYSLPRISCLQLSMHTCLKGVGRGRLGNKTSHPRIHMMLTSLGFLSAN